MKTKENKYKFPQFRYSIEPEDICYYIVEDGSKVLTTVYSLESAKEYMIWLYHGTSHPLGEISCPNVYLGWYSDVDSWEELITDPFSKLLYKPKLKEIPRNIVDAVKSIYYLITEKSSKQQTEAERLLGYPFDVKYSLVNLIKKRLENDQEEREWELFKEKNKSGFDKHGFDYMYSIYDLYVRNE